MHYLKGTTKTEAPPHVYFTLSFVELDICNVIDKEMDAVAKEDILSGLADISPDFIKSWMVTNASERAPILTEILFREVQTSLAKEQNKRKCPDSVCFYHHSCNCIPLSYGADV
jgi:hypothetical protein